MKKILMIMVVAAMFLFAGCSSSGPQITGASVKVNKIDGNDLKFDLIVDIARNDFEKNEQVVVYLKDKNSDYETSKDSGFLEGESNSKVKFDLSEEDYKGKTLDIELRLVQGTKELDKFDYTYTYE